MKCKCSTKFKKRFFGVAHRWRYTKLRYYWRLFWAKLKYVRFFDARGYHCWVDRYGRCYKCFPGPNMTRDEYDHWF